MRTVHNACTLDASDRRRLGRALAHCPDVRTYRRVQALWLWAGGYPLQQVCQISRCSRVSLDAWRRRYGRARRVEALHDAPRSGRPRQAPVLTRGRILTELKHKPWLLGYSTTVWTVVLLARQLSRRYGCRITPWTLRRRLHQSRLRWKRARHTYCRQEPHVAQKKGGHYQAFAAFAQAGGAAGDR
jgi:transposase